MALVETHRNEILAEVASERHRQQDQKLWSQDHDDMHSVNDWAALITRYTGRALEAAEVARADANDERPLAGPMYRMRLIQVAAIALAAIESYDRATAK